MVMTGFALVFALAGAGTYILDPGGARSLVFFMLAIIVGVAVYQSRPGSGVDR